MKMRGVVGELRNKWAKFDWPNHVWMIRDRLMDRWMDVIGSLIARMQFRLHGCRSVGKGLRVRGRVHIFTRRRNSIEIGDNVAIVSRFRSNQAGITNPCLLDTLMGGSIRIGHNVGMSGAILSSRSSITIGNHVKLGANVRVFDHNFHSLDAETRRDDRRDRHDVRTLPVVIGEDVFVGANAIILKGVRIGARAIVAAGAVVTRDVPAGEVWGGNPAACLKTAPPPAGGPRARRGQQCPPS
jgi:acetyltransferase-like isoleucine patch superfamily enzyme